MTLLILIPGALFIVLLTVADPGGGGPGGPDPPPPFGPRCRFFNIGPKVGPPPPFVNVQEWGCFSIFLRANDVTRTMSKGGGCACECPRVGVFFKFSEVG